MDADRGLPLGRTGPGGRVVLTLRSHEPGNLRFVGAAGAAARATVEPQPAGATPEPVAVRLAAPIRVTGRVIDAERRRPVAGALVWLPGGEDASATTDAQGGYALARDATWRGVSMLRGVAAGYFPRDVHLAEAAAAAPTLALDPAGSLLGSVTDPQGRALAGVEITGAALPDSMGMPRRVGFGLASPRATSDERGRFRLTGLDPRSRHGLVFRRAGYAPARREVTVPADRPGQLDVILAAGAAAQGLVVDERGQPVSAAELSLRRQEERGGEGFVMRFGDARSDEPDAEAASDRSGRFAFADLAPGRYLLEASATGYAKTSLPGVEVPESASPVDLGKVELAPGAAIIGRVVDGSGQPIASAEVFAITGEEAAFPLLRWTLVDREPVTTTAADGGFVVAGQRAGERVTVGARRSGYAVASAAGVVAPNDEPVVITLREASDIRGKVVDGRGDPVPGARVGAQVERSGGGMSFSGSLGMAAAGPDGRFELEDVEPGTIRLTVDAEGYLQLVRGGVEVPPGRDLENVELALQAGAVVEGVVTAPDGSPAIGARVGVLEEGQPGPMMRVWFAGIEADGDGRYRLSGVEPGRRTIAAQLEGFERGVAELEVVPGDNRLDLRLGAGQAVSGRVTGPRGEPIARAAVRLAPPGERWWSRHGATTDEAGGFTLEGIPDGTYEAIASHPEHAESVAEVNVAGASVTGLVLELGAAGAVVGELRGIQPEELARVSVNASKDRSWRQGEVDRDGRYRIAGLGAGQWRVSAQVEGSGRQAVGAVEVAGQGEATLDLEFSGGFAVHGLVRHEGRAVDGVMVTLVGQDVSGIGRTQTDYQGRYRVENLAAGRYQLEAADLVRGLRQRSDVTVDGDREVDVDLRSARIAGRVLEATSDEPVAGARLELEPADAERARFRFMGRADTDDRGAFVMGSVGEGRWRLVAQKEGYAPAELTLDLTGEPVDGLELRLQPTQGIVLTVARTIGSPPEQVYVAVLDGTGRMVTGGTYTTGENGTVRVSTAPPGSWEVLVRADGTGTERATVQSPGTPVGVLLAPQATLEVVVPELADDEGVATVVLRGADGRPFLFYRWAMYVRAEERMASGRTTLSGLPSGSWTVEVTGRDGRRWSAQAVTVAGSGSMVELR